MIRKSNIVFNPILLKLNPQGVTSAYYPEHQKRLHLFGTAKQLEKLSDIEAACLAFEIPAIVQVLVTDEEVLS